MATVRNLFFKYLGESLPSKLYTGVQGDGEFDSHHIPLWLTPDLELAKEYAKPYYAKSSGSVYEVTISGSARIVDILDLTDPLTRRIKDDFGVYHRSYSDVPIPDSQWSDYADFGLFEIGSGNLASRLRRWGADVVINIKDGDPYGGGNYQTIAVVNSSVIQSVRKIVNEDFEKAWITPAGQVVKFHNDELHNDEAEDLHLGSGYNAQEQALDGGAIRVTYWHGGFNVESRDGLTNRKKDYIYDWAKSLDSSYDNWQVVLFSAHESQRMQTTVARLKQYDFGE